MNETDNLPEKIRAPDDRSLSLIVPAIALKPVDRALLFEYQSERVF